MSALFRVLSGPYRGKVFPFAGGPRSGTGTGTDPGDPGCALLIGKALEADFTIPDAAHEAFHCAVLLEPGRGLHVRALEGKGRVQIGNAAADRGLVRSGERFRIGETWIELRESPLASGPAGGVPPHEGDEDTCAMCARGVAPGERPPRSGRVILGKTYCSRCVDLRLTVRHELGRYRVIRKMSLDIAEVVYMAEDVGSEPAGAPSPRPSPRGEREKGEPRRVALHVLRSERQNDPRGRRRFVTKAAFGLTLDHPAFARTLDITVRPEVLQYATELPGGADGGVASSLESRHKEGETFPLDRAVLICLRLIDAIEYARRRQIIIGRLRAGKILLDDRDEVHVTEFWLAREVEEALAASIESDPGSLTPDDIARGGRSLAHYVAPEAKDLGHARDEALNIKPLGICLYQLVTGSAPVRGAPPTEHLAVLKRVHAAYRKRTVPKTTVAPAPAAQALPSILAKVVARTLDPNPANRYRTLDELTRDLRATYLGL